MQESIQNKSITKIPIDLNLLKLKPINVGSEGLKWIAEVESKTAESLFTLFVKSMSSHTKALQQQRKHKDLKTLGINVPKGAYVHELNKGVWTLITSDLSENGKKFVLSCNNPELQDPKVISLIKSLNNKTIQKINDHLLFAAIQVSGLGKIKFERKYSLSNNTFALVLDPKNLEKSKAVAIDYGLDLDLYDYYEKSYDVLYRNVFKMACFFAIVLGKELMLPEDPIFDLINRDVLKRYCQERINGYWIKN